MAEVRAPMIDVEIVYALPHEQFARTLSMPTGATVAQAIAASGVLLRYPEISLATAAVGIFGKRAAMSSQLSEFDRVEIYRLLSADPKQSRRARARKTARSSA